jgi:hypothetical protein
MRRLPLLIAAAALLAASPAQAWWEYGHQTIAEIALAKVTPRTRAAIRRLLAHGDLLDTPKCPARSIEDASVWADCVKSYKDRYGYAYSWHFQDIDVCKPFDITANCADGNCVTRQIPRVAAVLKDRHQPLRARVEALAFLIHFVGDLHQPLHVGERQDQGGNKLAASYGVIAGRTNLHTIWDGYLAERAISAAPGGARGLMREITPREQVAWAQGGVAEWARDSWQVAHDSAYGAVLSDPCGPEPARVTIDETQVQALTPIVRRQIEKGGIRLAKMLDAALG